MTSRDLERWS